MTTGKPGQPWGTGEGGQGIEAHLSPSLLSCGSQVAAAPGLLAALRKEVGGRRAVEASVGEGS